MSFISLLAISRGFVNIYSGSLCCVVCGTTEFPQHGILMLDQVRQSRTMDVPVRYNLLKKYFETLPSYLLPIERRCLL